MRATLAARPIIRAATVRRRTIVFGAGAALLLAILVAGVALGSVVIPLDETAAVLTRHLFGAGYDGAARSTADTIVFDLRLPRVLTAMLVGAALGGAGVVFQALLRNPLADPYVIGTAAGASLGAILGILLPALLPALGIGIGSVWLGLGAAQLMAFVGGLGTVLVVFAVARTAGGAPATSLVLTGYAISSLIAAAIALLMFVSGRALGVIFAWLMGSLAGSSWSDLAIATPLVAAGAVLVIGRWRRLNVLLLGDEAAAHLGIEVEREKLTLTLLATLMTSAAVAVSGTIGFIGLVVPHVLRGVMGGDHRLLLPASMLYGAVLLAVADLGARLAGGIPVGIVTALVGAPFFIGLLRRGRYRAFAPA
ncbi:MAG: iron ABC transporter permease [Chloroflexota bacterium]|nr:iron ABC transporter permease [Chloroflexota bacterium]